MKKNLRIVSAAAAALLAVAPVAATAVATPATTVSAADQTNTQTFLNKGAEVTLTNTLNTAKGVGSDKGEINITLPTDAVGDKAGTAIAKGTKVKVVNATKTENVVVSYTGSDKKVHYAVLNQSALLQMVTTDDKGSENIVADKNIPNTIFAENPNTSVNISAVAASHSANGVINWTGAVNGNIVYTDAQGQSHTAILHGDGNTSVYAVTTKNGKPVMEQITDGNQLRANQQYVADFKDVTVNLGNAQAGKSVKFVLSNTAWFAKHDKNAADNVQTVTVDSNGVAHLGEVFAKFYAYDSANSQEVHFYSVKTGNVVTSGSVNLHAVNGRLNISSLFTSMTQEYVANQLNGSVADTLVPQNDLRDQLEKQNIKVDPNGYFTAPASFTLNLNAKSNTNGATATLPVTVTVDNVTPTAAQETTKTVTIMHIAAIYDKNGVATHDPALRAYDTYSVVAEPVTINGAKFYKLAGKDQYIKVGNVDGTSRTLKHNSYVYKSTGKRANKKTLKKGSSVTTYGKSFMIAGHQMYRIGKNQYVKKANF